MRRAFVFLMLLAPFASVADERILSFHSDILVRADGWIEVTETIEVRAEGQQIRRGILRDYPVRFEDKLGNDVVVRYEPVSVTRNGFPEAFRSEQQGRNVRVYFGRADRLIDVGEHTYVYRYNAGRMLGFFAGYDELYWNVTGNDSIFPMDNASASVAFEFVLSAGQLQLEAYTGTVGNDGNAYTAEVDSTGRAWFRTTTGLAQGDGLTISVGWPKGFVSEPGDLQELTWLLSDNANLVAALIGLFAMIGYYIPVWRRHGKDPQPGVIYTRYKPPEGFSPASLRYIENMGYDNSVMTAAVVSLAVKGYLRIDVAGEIHTLQRQDPGANAALMATGEKELFDELFGDGHDLTLIDENHARIGGAKIAHEKSLKHDYHKRYFRTNGILNLPPLLAGIGAAVVALAIGPSLGVFILIGLMIAALITFAIIMKQPTAPGRQVMNQSAGFREYLEIAEKDELNLRNPPDKTPQLFEQHLPFALALGVEQQWAEQFSRIFARLQGPNNVAWQPSWYGGAWNNFDLNANTVGLSAGLTSAISSSVSPPGSTSGSAGGGFSGGGGGGGGVGGW